MRIIRHRRRALCIPSVQTSPQFPELKKAAGEYTAKIQESANAIAALDVLCALADCAVTYQYCRPHVSDGDILQISGGRHPVLDAQMEGERFVPNDTMLDGEDNRMMIITGPNMAGKSTYIRQTALLVIMAQMGSFIPADEAWIGIADQIFTRVGAMDDIARGQSTFMVEMTEVAEILKNATSRSLLILDEIQSGCGRSGKFFAFQYSNVTPDIVTMAKGIANGFPVGATLISPKFEAVKGQLGTTFGGNYLGMAAAIAVMDIIKDEKLVENAAEVGAYIMANLPKSDKIKSVKGYGLMIGIEFNEPMKEIRSKLLFEKHIFTGMAGTNMIRILPPLTLTKAEADEFLSAFKDVVS